VLGKVDQIALQPGPNAQRRLGPDENGCSPSTPLRAVVLVRRLRLAAFWQRVDRGQDRGEGRADLIVLLGQLGLQHAVGRKHID